MSFKKLISKEVFEWVSPLVVFFFFLAIFIDSFFLKGVIEDYVGPGFMPRVVSGLGLVCLARVMWQQVREHKETKKNKTVENVVEEKEELTISHIMSTYATTISIVLIAAYIAALPIIGFKIASTIYLFVQMLVAAPEGKRNPVLFAVLAVVVSFGLYYLFYNVFNVFLPVGSLFK